MSISSDYSFAPIPDEFPARRPPAESGNTAQFKNSVTEMSHLNIYNLAYAVKEKIKIRYYNKQKADYSDVINSFREHLGLSQVSEDGYQTVISQDKIESYLTEILNELAAKAGAESLDLSVQIKTINAALEGTVAGSALSRKIIGQIFSNHIAELVFAGAEEGEHDQHELSQSVDKGKQTTLTEAETQALRLKNLSNRAKIKLSEPLNRAKLKSQDAHGYDYDWELSQLQPNYQQVKEQTTITAEKQSLKDQFKASEPERVKVQQQPEVKSPEVEQHKREIEQSKRTLEELQHRFRSLKETKESEIRQLQDELSQSASELQNKSFQIEELNKENMALKARQAKTFKSAQSHTGTSMPCGSAPVIMPMRLNAPGGTFECTNTGKSNPASDISAEENYKGVILEQIKQQNKEIKQQNENNKQLQAENKALIEKKIDCEKIITQLELVIQKKDDAQQEAGTADNITQFVQTLEDEKKQLESQLNKAGQQISKLEHQLAEEKDALKKVKQDKQIRDDRILAENLAQSERKTDITQNLIDQLFIRQQEDDQQISALNDKLAEKAQLAQQPQSFAVNLEKVLDTAENENKELKSKLKKAEQIAADLTAKLAEKEQLAQQPQSFAVNLEKVLDTAENQNKELKSKLKKAEQIAADLTVKLAEKEQLAQQPQSFAVNLEKVLDTAENQNKELKIKLEETRKLILSLNQELIVKEARIVEVEKEKQTIHSQLLATDSKNTALIDEINIKKKNIDRLTKSLNEAKPQPALANIGFDSLQQTLEAVNQSLQDQVAQQNLKIDKYEKALKDLQSELEKTRESFFELLVSASAFPGLINEVIGKQQLQQYFSSLVLINFNIAAMRNFKLLLQKQTGKDINFSFDGEDDAEITKQQREQFAGHLNGCGIKRIDFALTVYRAASDRNISNAFGMSLNVLQGKDTLLTEV